MLVLLSSGTRDRYLDDIIRCLALPPKTDLQFRYSRSWLSESVLTKIADGKIRNAKALICYIDQSAIGTIHIVPCRAAQIINVTPVGSSLAIQLRVSDLPTTKSLDSVQKEIIDSKDCPAWDKAGGLKGKWFFEQELPSLEFIPSSNLETWEQIVKALLLRNDFKKRDFFFHVDGIRKARNSNNIIPVGGEYRLDPSQEYELAVYHYHPKDDPSSAKVITFASSSDKLKLSSLPNARVDSRYDLKRWRFKCEGGLTPTSLILEIRTSGSGDPKDEITQIELPATIKIDWKGVIAKLALVILGLMVTSLTTLQGVGKLDWGTVAIALLGAVLAAIGTVWKSS